VIGGLIIILVVVACSLFRVFIVRERNRGPAVIVVNERIGTRVKQPRRAPASSTSEPPLRFRVTKQGYSHVNNDVGEVISSRRSKKKKKSPKMVPPKREETKYE
jgi:hypothetical protein